MDMRTRTLGGLFVVLVVLGAFATGAAATKPTLWLKRVTSERAAPGTAVSVIVGVENNCFLVQGGSLASNGKASDKLSFAPPSEQGLECGSEKLAGSVKGVAMTPSGVNQAVITIKGKLHELVAPWCQYALPKTIMLQPEELTYAEATVSATLEAHASHGPCTPTRTVYVTVEVEDTENGYPFIAETVG
jgi:hypothetical protein